MSRNRTYRQLLVNANLERIVANFCRQNLKIAIISAINITDLDLKTRVEGLITPIFSKRSGK